MAQETTLEDYLISVLTGGENEQTSAETGNDIDTTAITTRMKRIRTTVSQIINVILENSKETADINYYTNLREERLEEYKALAEQLDKAA